MIKRMDRRKKIFVRTILSWEPVISTSFYLRITHDVAHVSALPLQCNWIGTRADDDVTARQEGCERHGDWIVIIPRSV